MKTSYLIKEHIGDKEQIVLHVNYSEEDLKHFTMFKSHASLSKEIQLSVLFILSKSLNLSNFSFLLA